MKLKIYTYWQQYEWESKPSLRVFEFSRKDDKGFVPAGEFEVDLPIATLDHAEIVKARVAVLRKEQAELFVKQGVIEDRIQKLLAIEYKPEAEVSHG